MKCSLPFVLLTIAGLSIAVPLPAGAGLNNKAAAGTAATAATGKTAAAGTTAAAGNVAAAGTTAAQGTTAGTTAAAGTANNLDAQAAAVGMTLPKGNGTPQDEAAAFNQDVSTVNNALATIAASNDPDEIKQQASRGFIAESDEDNHRAPLAAMAGDAGANSNSLIQQFTPDVLTGFKAIMNNPSSGLDNVNSINTVRNPNILPSIQQLEQAAAAGGATTGTAAAPAAAAPAAAAGTAATAGTAKTAGTAATAAKAPAAKAAAGAQTAAAGTAAAADEDDE